MEAKPVLIIESDLQMQQQLVEILTANGCETMLCRNPAAAIAISKTEKFSLAILNASADANEILDIMVRLQQNQPELPVVMITEFDAIHKAVFATQVGAADYLVKPFMPERLLSLIRRHAINIVDNAYAPVAESKSMRMAINTACKVAKSSVKVLISGDVGAGKKTIAKYIHNASAVSGGIFTVVNCAVDNPDIIDTVLFGYKKKNALGNYEELPGRLELAKDGTLVLDEISELTTEMQAKLLKVFKDKVIKVENREKVIPLKARIIATTSKDLYQEVREGRFSEALYFMLSVFPIKMPTLRERKEDIIPLAEQLLATIAMENGEVELSLAEDAKSYLLKKKWQNNISELKNMLAATLKVATDRVITLKNLTATEFDELSIVAAKGVNNKNTNSKAMF